jgi:vitamin B12 transporter
MIFNPKTTFFVRDKVCIALFWGFVLFGFSPLFSQPDSLRQNVLRQVEIVHYDSIQLVPQIQSTVSGGVVLREEIERKNPDDLGEMTRSFPGVFLRSYGGVGGLKTMNARGLGSQHFAVVTNGMPAMFHQNGSANLGDIQADFIEAIKFSLGGSDEWGLPVLAKTHSGILQVFTTDYMFIPNRKKIEVSGLYGSFNHHKWSLNTTFSDKKSYLSVNGYGMYFGGDYPFSYTNGLTTVEEIRNFNTIHENAFRVGSGVELGKGHLLQAGYQYFKSDKVLPGAIVFYQPEHYQTLLTENSAFNAQYQIVKRRFKSKKYVNFGQQLTDYRNPFALGGERTEIYIEKTLDVSHSSLWQISNTISTNWGVQYMYGSLDANTDIVNEPIRHRGFAQFGINWKPSNWIFRLDLPTQLLAERNDVNETWKNTPLFTPSFGANYRVRKNKYVLIYRGSASQSARVATFNELFYGQIGNTNVRPERAKMLNLGGAYTVHLDKNVSIDATLDGFLGHIADKIVTLPTQNLFVWSVRNIGEVLSYGFDASFTVEKKSVNKKAALRLIQKTALNISQDITDVNSPTYGHQIPYTPYWNYSGELVGEWKIVQVSYEMGYYDFRFVLGENNAANVLDEYWLHGIRLSIQLKSKSVNWRIYGKVNNLFNKQYQVMRSFPMPGINGEVGIKMGWNGK